jgi:hypothetical protein
MDLFKPIIKEIDEKEKKTLVLDFTTKKVKSTLTEDDFKDILEFLSTYSNNAE